MAQFTIYRNTDGSAPTLNGTVGSLVSLLDACLVTGYGAKAAAGWTKPFTGANKASFKQGTGSNGMYLRVQDDAPGAGGAKEARLTGYEVMTTVDAGTNPFPNAAQGIGGVAMVVGRKSVTADATARDWIVIADARTVYVCIKSEVAVSVAGAYSNFGFGEFFSFQLNDPYRVFILGRDTENTALATADTFTRIDGAISTQTAAHFMPRGHNATYGPIHIGKTGDAVKAGAQDAGLGLVPYTNPSGGLAILAPLWLSDPITLPANGLRGRFRGIWQFLHPVASVNDGDTLPGTGELAGKTFLFIKTCGSFSTATGIGVIETSNTLETN